MGSDAPICPIRDAVAMMAILGAAVSAEHGDRITGVKAPCIGSRCMLWAEPDNDGLGYCRLGHHETGTFYWPDPAKGPDDAGEEE